MFTNHPRRPELAVASFALATSFFALMSPAQAQTVCTTAILGTLNCTDPLLTVTGTVSGGGVVVPGAGLTATSPGDMTVVLVGDVSTTGDNEPGVLLNTANDLIFTLDGSVTTLGDNSQGVILLAGEDITADLESVTTSGIGSDAIIATATGNLDITSDTVATLQDDSGGRF